MTTYTPAEIVAEVEREIKMREQVYAREHRMGRLTLEEMSRRIGIMQQVKRDYEKQIGLASGNPSRGTPDADSFCGAVSDPVASGERRREP